MPIIIVVLGPIGAIMGIVGGIIFTIKPIGYFLEQSGKSGMAGFELLPAFLGIYLVICGIVGLVGTTQLRKHPRTGAGLLLGSAIAGFLPLYSIPTWGFAGLLELLTAILAFSGASKMERMSRRPPYYYPNYPPNYPNPGNYPPPPPPNYNNDPNNFPPDRR